MAKLLYPPMFTKLEEFFDLLLDPQKYAGYVQQLKDLHSAVGERLEALDSKQKADEYMSKAAALLEQATKESAQVMADAQRHKQDATRLMAEAQATQTTLATKQAVFDQECRSKQEALAQRELEVSKSTTDLEARYAALDGYKNSLDRKEADLDEREAKISQAKQALHAMGL